MGRISIPTNSLFILGVILIIIAGFTGPEVPTNVWLRNLPYLFLIGGLVFIILAVVLMLRKH